MVKSRPNPEQIPPVSWKSKKDNFAGGCEQVLLYNYTYGDLFFILFTEIRVVLMKTKFFGSYLHDLKG